jgi:ribosome maturation factor RimP
MELDRELEELIGREVDSLGYELVKIEAFLSGRRKTIRIFIDRPDQPVTIDDCVRVSRALGFVLDGVETLPGPFNLEISSPGETRPLTKGAHFRRFRGERVRIEYLDPAGAKTTAIGTIDDADGETVTLSVDGSAPVIPLERILKANLHPAPAGGSKESRRVRRKRDRRRGERL